MIPKIIHYCWFGHGEKPELALKCIESWKKWCPDYNIIEWNEDNFDISSNQYVKEAYHAKKYAFVTDYVRLYAMYNYGGIYMDTDVMVLKSLDEFLSKKAFSGFETEKKIQTGIMASEKEHYTVKNLLTYYDTAKFFNSDDSYNIKTNVETITEYFLKKGFIPNGQKQTIEDFTLYPKNIFCPTHKKLNDSEYMKDTATIHYFAGSWKSDATKKRESSVWWKFISKPASIFSFLMNKIFGNNWMKIKSKILKIIKR